jgi:KDO2-lipid IV(A) lauroyltransferase
MRADSNLSEIRWHADGLNNGVIFGLTRLGVVHLPRRCSYAIGHVGTWLAYRLMRAGTKAVVANLRAVRPDASELELRALALSTYRSYARDTIDFIGNLDMNQAELTRWVARHDDAPLRALLARGRGVIIAGGHFGNWELGGVMLRVLSGHPLLVVGKQEASAGVGKIRRRMRDSLGIETLEIGQMLETALRIRRHLAANGVVAMLLDRHVGRDRVDISFFGRQTSFLRTPAMIAGLSGAPLLPAFMVRQKDNRFAGEFGQPIYVDPGDRTDEALRNATQAFATQLEQRIRADPHCWYQFYRYWDPDVSENG